MRIYFIFFIMLALALLMQSATTGIVSVSISPDVFEFNLSVSAESNATTITINNTGTENISSLYAYVSTPSSNPYSSGIASNYDAGNFLMFENETGNLFFANHAEFNETLPVYVTMPDNAVAGGRFRLDIGDYFWAITPGSKNNCTNGTIFIGLSNHNKTSMGDVMLDNKLGDKFSVIDNGLRGAIDVDVDGDKYCAIVEADCSRVMFVKWNQGSAPFDSGSVCNNDQYIFSGLLQPNQTVNITMRLNLPYSVATGNLTQGTFTIVASV